MDINQVETAPCQKCGKLIAKQSLMIHFARCKPSEQSSFIN